MSKFKVCIFHVYRNGRHFFLENMSVAGLLMLEKSNPLLEAVVWPKHTGLTLSSVSWVPVTRPVFSSSQAHKMFQITAMMIAICTTTNKPKATVNPKSTLLDDMMFRESQLASRRRVKTFSAKRWLLLEQTGRPQNAQKKSYVRINWDVSTAKQWPWEKKPHLMILLLIAHRLLLQQLCARMWNKSSY